MINSCGATVGGGSGKEDAVDHAAEGEGDMAAVAETADVNGNCTEGEPTSSAESTTNEQQASRVSNHNVIVCPVQTTHDKEY